MAWWETEVNDLREQLPVLVWVNANWSPKREAPARLHHHLVVEKAAVSIIHELWTGGGYSEEDLDGRGDHSDLAAYLIANVAGLPSGKKWHAALDGARAEAAKELQDKLDTAEREAREARAAMEAAEKRAKLSDADTALFGEYFQTVQRDFARMSELLKKVREQDATRGEKLTAAMRAVLDKCRAELEL